MEFDMKLKLTLFASVLATTLTVPVNTPLLQFTAVDTQMLFEQDAKPMQLVALLSQEMKGRGLGFHP